MRKTVAITTDGAANFKCALKRHGDYYETFDQLMQPMGGFDEELFHLDLADLTNQWCPSSELIDDDVADVMPIEFPHSDDADGDTDFSVENFAIELVPSEILEHVVDDHTKENAVLLPSRIDCCAHAFNSIGRTDSFNALRDDAVYAARYISVFKKLNAIWKMNSTRNGREVFVSYLKKHKIQKPHRIRWNRIFDAVR